jgi:hypothetical protein
MLAEPMAPFVHAWQSDPGGEVGGLYLPLAHDEHETAPAPLS